MIAQPSLQEAIEVLQAAHDVGIRRVHYTGGEPTVRRDFLDLLRAAKETVVVPTVVVILRGSV